MVISEPFLLSIEWSVSVTTALELTGVSTEYRYRYSTEYGVENHHMEATYYNDMHIAVQDPE